MQKRALPGYLFATKECNTVEESIIDRRLKPHSFLNLHRTPEADGLSRTRIIVFNMPQVLVLA